MANMNLVDFGIYRQLLADHELQLKLSAIGDDVIKERGYFSAFDKKDLSAIGFRGLGTPTPALVIPVHTVTGDTIYQVRPNSPRITKGKPRKYEFAPRTKMCLDVPMRVLPQLKDPSIPLFLTEGSKKVDAAITQGLCCIGVLGVWNWRGMNDQDGVLALPDWEYIALNGRLIYICFDSDVMTKSSVHRALVRLRRFLQSRGAIVEVIYLPDSDDKKQGLDDFFASGHTPAELIALATTELREPPPKHTGYEQNSEGIFLITGQPGNQTRTYLATFQAWIVGDRIEDDGVEQTRVYDMVARLGDAPEKRFAVPANQFGGMRWVSEHLGSQAIIFPQKTELVRAAIQVLSAESNEFVERIIYKHTGWRKIDGEWKYLHSGGAISKDGLEEDVEVSLPDDLIDMTLPQPQIGEQLVSSIKEFLNSLGVAPLYLTLVLFLAPFRAVLGKSDFGLFIYGQTGTRKTTMASICQRFFGANLCEERPVADFTGTANAIEVLQFIVKDALIFVDDFAPSKDPATMHRKEALADRMYRGNAGGSGRSRLNPDSTLKVKKYARGLILSTGEEMPGVRSMRARVIAVEIKPDDLDLKMLRQVERASRQGVFAGLLSAVVKWLAPQYEDVRRTLKDDVADLRDSLELKTGHSRMVENLANLIVAARYLLRFFLESEAISVEESRKLEESWTEALRGVGEGQERFQLAEDPVEQFIEILKAALTGGLARIHSRDGKDKDPSIPVFCWLKETSALMTSGKHRIGWFDYSFRKGVEDLYLHPEWTLVAVHEFCTLKKTQFGLSRISLEKYLNDRGMFKSTGLSTSRKTYTIRRRCEGVTYEVWHFPLDILKMDAEEDVVEQLSYWDSWKSQESTQALSVGPQKAEAEVKEQTPSVDSNTVELEEESSPVAYEAKAEEGESSLAKWDPAMDEEEEDSYVAPWDTEG